MTFRNNAHCQDYGNKPNSRARATASVRRPTCSLPKMFWLCPLTLLRARNNRLPMSSFESPSSSDSQATGLPQPAAHSAMSVVLPQPAFV